MDWGLTAMDWGLTIIYPQFYFDVQYDLSRIERLGPTVYFPMINDCIK